MDAPVSQTPCMGMSHAPLANACIGTLSTCYFSRSEGTLKHQTQSLCPSGERFFITLHYKEVPFLKGMQMTVMKYDPKGPR